MPREPQGTLLTLWLGPDLRISGTWVEKEASRPHGIRETHDSS